MPFSYSLIRVWLGGRLSFKLHQFSISITDANGELYTRASRTARILHRPAHRSRESRGQVTKLPLLWHKKEYPTLFSCTQKFWCKAGIEMANLGISQDGFSSAGRHAPFILARLRERARLAARSLPCLLVTDHLALELPLPGS